MFVKAHPAPVHRAGAGWLNVSLGDARAGEGAEGGSILIVPKDGFVNCVSPAGRVRKNLSE